MRRATGQSLALAFIFMLAVRDVSAAREAFNVAEMVTLTANSLRQSDEFHERVETVTEAGSFSMQTMWAKGKDNPRLGHLTWHNATITFRHATGGPGEPEKYVEVTGMDKPYRLLPDALVMNKAIKTMAVVGIVGWQAFDGGSWGPSTYGRSEMLWIRTEMNPIIGHTTSSTLSWRYAGSPVYRKGSGKPYYLYKGVQKTIDIESVSQASEPTPASFSLDIPGQASKPLMYPDRELMLLVDAMIGQNTCMNSPSQCAYRCQYDPENDMCGPHAFCNKVDTDEMSILAPFGSQQKCKAVGGSSHEEADAAITNEAIPTLKMLALNVTKKLADMPAVAQSSASVSTVKKTAALWKEAADILQVFESLAARLGPDVGKFTDGSRRVSLTDMKYWRHRQDRLTQQQYEAAQTKSIAELKASTDFSVPAKLHSELVDFMTKRPRLIVQMANLESKGKCLLKDATQEDQDQLTLFVKYFLKVPGYNSRDLTGQTLDLPENCQEHLQNKGGTSMDDLMSSADEAKEQMDAAESGAEMPELQSERLRTAVSQDAEASSLLQSGSWSDASEEARRTLIPIFIVILLAVSFMMLAGLCFDWALYSISDLQIQPNWIAFVIAFACGCFMVVGAFTVAWPVGLAVLIGSVAGAYYHNKKIMSGPSLLQEPDSKISTPHRAAVQLHLGS